MKQTEENEQTKSFQQPWVFVLGAPSFQVTVYISSGSQTYCPVTIADSSSTHQKSKGVGSNKHPMIWSAKPLLAKYWSHHIHLYTSYILPSPFFWSKCFPFVHPSVSSMLKRDKNSPHDLSYCKINASLDKHQHSTELRYIFWNWCHPQTSSFRM